MTIRSIASYSNRRVALGLALVLIFLAQVAFMPDRWQTFRCPSPQA